MQCPCCGAPIVEPALHLGWVPRHSCLSLHSADEAREYPRGALALAACTTCGYLFNPHFEADSQQFAAGYESSQAFSGQFRRFASGLAEDLVSRYSLRGGAVLEIGCGSGEFLQLLREFGVAHGIGVDPAYHPERGVSGPGLVFYPEYYGPQHGTLVVDLALCRHTLEHIAAPLAFMQALAKHLGSTPVFFEVPDALRIIQHGAFWDVYYEHCAYYTPACLAGLFRRTGFRVVDLALEYDDQYLLLWAVPADGQAEPLHPLEQRSPGGQLLASLRQAQQHWQEQLRAWCAAGERLVLWGSGSKAVAFVSAMGDLASSIEAVVDINPRRQGLFLAGCGLPIVAPEALCVAPPDRVLVMNPIYRQEVAEQLQGLGVAAELVCLPV